MSQYRYRTVHRQVNCLAELDRDVVENEIGLLEGEWLIQAAMWPAPASSAEGVWVSYIIGYIEKLKAVAL